MKLPEVMDDDDWNAIAGGIIYFVLAVVALLGFAAAVGLAWVVFRLAGGL